MTVYEVQKQWKTESSSIYITNDEDFISLGLEGEGTEEELFIIEDETINNKESRIKITNTSKYFIIRDCFINTRGIGIQISKVQPGTAKNEGNRIINGLKGIEVEKQKLSK